MSYGTITIANGETESDTLHMGGRRVLTIGAPAALTGVVTLHSSLDGSTYQPHQKDGSDITIAAAENMTVTDLDVHSVKVVSAGAEGAERVFTVRRNIQ